MTFLEKLNDYIINEELFHDNLNNDYEEDVLQQVDKVRKYLVKRTLEQINNFGAYLNDIPSYAHEEYVERISSKILEFITASSIHEAYNETTLNEGTSAPGTILKQDIKILKDAKDIILKKVYYGDNYAIEKPLGNIHDYENGIENDRKKHNEELDTREKENEELFLFHEFHNSLTDEISEIIENTNNTIKLERESYNTYFYLDDLIKDLEKKEFKISHKFAYYGFQSPNKKSIRVVLSEIRTQFKLKASLHEKQLLDNL